MIVLIIAKGILVFFFILMTGIFGLLTMNYMKNLVENNNLSKITFTDVFLLGFLITAFFTILLVIGGIMTYG